MFIVDFVNDYPVWSGLICGVLAFVGVFYLRWLFFYIQKSKLILVFIVMAAFTSVLSLHLFSNP